MTTKRDRCGAAIAISLFLFAREGWASPTFPDAVASDLGAAKAPACTVCHETPAGGVGTANTAFGAYMRSRGLRAEDLDSLRSALDAASGERHDSDGDGVSDIDALKAGEDPNGGGASVPRTYGCGAQLAPSAPGGGWLLIVAVLAGSLLFRKRSR